MKACYLLSSLCWWVISYLRSCSLNEIVVYTCLYYIVRWCHMSHMLILVHYVLTLNHIIQSFFHWWYLLCNWRIGLLVDLAKGGRSGFSSSRKGGLLGPVLGGLTMVHLLDHSEDPTDYGHPMANFQGCQLGYHWILQIGHLGYFGHKASINEQNYPMMDFGPHPYVQKNHVVSFISCYIPIYSWLDPHELTDFGFQNVIRNRASRKLPPHLRSCGTCRA